MFGSAPAQHGPVHTRGMVAKCAASGQLGLGKSPRSSQEKPAAAYRATIRATTASAQGLSVTRLHGNTAGTDVTHRHKVRSMVSPFPCATLCHVQFYPEPVRSQIQAYRQEDGRGCHGDTGSSGALSKPARAWRAARREVRPQGLQRPRLSGGP